MSIIITTAELIYIVYSPN